MSTFWKHVPQTVRPRSVGKTSVLLCLVVFGLTATAVYRWGYDSWTPTNPKPIYTATAYVVERPHEASTGEVRIPIASTDDDPRHAEEVANAQADRYVRNRRAEWQHRTEGPCLKAREAAEQSRHALAQAEARLEAFKKQLAARTAKPQAVVQDGEKPSMIDNPEWVDLNAQLREFQRRHDALLIERTPAHPAVQETLVRIEDIKRQMASVPQKIPGKMHTPSESHDIDGGSAETVTAENWISKPDQEKLDDLIAAAQRAGEACDGAEAAEKQVLRLQQTGPQYAIEAAQVVEIAATPDYGWRRLIWTTLVAGVLMAFGVGSLSVGANIEPPVGTVGEVRKTTKATVVGTIPAHDPVPDAAKCSRRQWYVRRTLIAIGLGLIAACPVFAIWGVTGI